MSYCGMNLFAKRRIRSRILPLKQQWQLLITNELLSLIWWQHCYMKTIVKHHFSGMTVMNELMPLLLMTIVIQVCPTSKKNGCMWKRYGNFKDARVDINNGICTHPSTCCTLPQTPNKHTSMPQSLNTKVVDGSMTFVTSLTDQWLIVTRGMLFSEKWTFHGYYYLWLFYYKFQYYSCYILSMQ